MPGSGAGCGITNSSSGAIHLPLASSQDLIISGFDRQVMGLARDLPTNHVTLSRFNFSARRISHVQWLGFEITIWTDRTREGGVTLVVHLRISLRLLIPAWILQTFCVSRS
jgi:hypothetical protein